MLINIATLQRFQFQIPEDNIENINYYNALIASASSIIVNYVGSAFTPEQYVEYFDDIRGGRYLVLKRLPVASIEEIIVDGKVYDKAYTYEVINGVLRFEDPLHEKSDIKITYTAGYDEVPQDIQYATVELVQYLKKRMSNSLVGESSKNIDGGSINLETSIPLNVLHILNRYKWKSICV